MKIGQFFKKMVGGSVILATLACPVFTSCYDDSELWTEIDSIKGSIASIQEKLNDELAALKTLLENQVSVLQGKVDGLTTVSTVETLNSGAVVVTLSNGTSFTVNPAQNNKGLVTTLEIEGTLYWAVFDDKGDVTLVLDSENSPIPVVAATPQVRVDEETSLVEISFDGGATWESIGYNERPESLCVFSGAEVIYTDNYTDEEETDYGWTEEPKCVVLTLPDGNTITLTIDGYGRFAFGSAYGGTITEQYISPGFVSVLQASTVGVESWIKEVPAGWEVKEDASTLQYGYVEFTITAPTEEAIASGMAVEEGDMKVLAVLEGGKTSTAVVTLTTKAFKSLSAAKGNAYVDMNNGCAGYILGIAPAESYDEESIIAEVQSVMDSEAADTWSGTWSPWYTSLNYFDYSLSDVPLTDINPDLQLSSSYVMYAIALNYMTEGYDSWYEMGALTSIEFVYNNISLETTKVAFNDVQVKVEFHGVSEFYGGFSEIYDNEAPTLKDIVDNINSGLSSPWGGLYPNSAPESGVYNGDPNTLVNGYQAIEPGCKYYLWLVPAGKTSYAETDIYYYEFETEKLLSGGSINLEAPADSLVTTTYVNITVPFDVEGAVYIYYQWVEPEMVDTIADKAAYLLENGNMAKGPSVEINAYNLSAGTVRTLVAMAVDENGCYGDVLVKEYSTKSIEYADVTLDVELVGTPTDSVTFKITPSVPVAQYIYYCNTTDHYVWSYYLKDAATASEYIALNPNNYNLKKIAAADVPADGLVFYDLTLGAPSVFVVSAVLEDGSISKAKVVEFKPEIDFGEFVYSTDDNGNENPDWAAKRPVVEYTAEMIGDFGTVKWTVSGLEEGFTAYTAIFHKDNLSPYPTDKDKATYLLTDSNVNREDVVADKTYNYYYASKGYMIAVIIKDAEGDYYAPYFYDVEGLGGFGVE